MIALSKIYGVKISRQTVTVSTPGNSAAINVMEAISDGFILTENQNETIP